MRIEKTETVELLDWEKENGLEIVITNNELLQEDKDKFFYLELTNCCIKKSVYTDFRYDKNYKISLHSSSIDTGLSSIAKAIRGRTIYYKCDEIVKILSCPDNLVHTKLVEPEKDTSKKWDEVVDKCNSEMNDFFTELDKMECFKGCFKIKKEPPIHETVSKSSYEIMEEKQLNDLFNEWVNPYYEIVYKFKY